MKTQTLLDLSGKEDFGHWDSSDFVFKDKKDKKNLKHLISSKITEGPALSIVDHSTHTYTQPSSPSVVPSIKLMLPLPER